MDDTSLLRGWASTVFPEVYKNLNKASAIHRDVAGAPQRVTPTTAQPPQERLLGYTGDEIQRGIGKVEDFANTIQGFNPFANISPTQQAGQQGSIVNAMKVPPPNQVDYWAALKERLDGGMNSLVGFFK